jgi:hypothetical protein
MTQLQHDQSVHAAPEDECQIQSFDVDFASRLADQFPPRLQHRLQRGRQLRKPFRPQLSRLVEGLYGFNQRAHCPGYLRHPDFFRRFVAWDRRAEYELITLLVLERPIAIGQSKRGEACFQLAGRDQLDGFLLRITQRCERVNYQRGDQVIAAGVVVIDGWCSDLEFTRNRAQRKGWRAILRDLLLGYFLDNLLQIWNLFF